jgi:hypothetical protein
MSHPQREYRVLSGEPCQMGGAVGARCDRSRSGFPEVAAYHSRPSCYWRRVLPHRSRAALSSPIDCFILASAQAPESARRVCAVVEAFLVLHQCQTTSTSIGDISGKCSRFAGRLVIASRIRSKRQVFERPQKDLDDNQ